MCITWVKSRRTAEPRGLAQVGSARSQDKRAASIPSPPVPLSAKACLCSGVGPLNADHPGGSPYQVRVALAVNDPGE
ncbi:unnamed protein product [Arctogadus glacialis]